MSVITVDKQEPYRSLVLSGKKVVEGRLNKGKFASLKVGDILKMEPENVLFFVVEKNIYKSFREMIQKEGIENVIPDKTSIDEAVDVYYKYYTPEQEKKFGVVAIKVKRK